MPDAQGLPEACPSDDVRYDVNRQAMPEAFPS